MTTYENSYLGVSLKVPDDWLLTTWRDSTIAPAWRKAYQLGDDDVPRDGDPAASKFLFTAVRHLPGSDIRVLADIELSVCLLPQTLGLRDQLLANFRRQQAHYADSGIISTITGEGT